MRWAGFVASFAAAGAVAGVAAAQPSSWHLVRGKHWQIASTAAVEPVRGLLARGPCDSGMVHVEGRMKQDLSSNPFSSSTVEELQKTTCVRWINREYPERCAEFDRARWLSIAAKLPTRAMDFCIDRYEFPNQEGEYPLAMVAFHEASALCAEQGKRLCDEAEWTFSCEGEEAMPYPYGYVRDATACVVDSPWRAFNPAALSHRDSTAAGAEMARLWQGVPSGSMPRCTSPFGVHDLTGNVDEWTRSVRPGERPSILKGGYWGPVRTRCRPATRTHDENHVFYQQGFRCCSEVRSSRLEASLDEETPLPRALP